MRASARNRCGSSCTKFCSSLTKTRPNTRRSSRPHALHAPRPWTCCSEAAPLIRPTSSTGNAFCWKTFLRVWVFLPPRRRPSQIRCRALPRPPFQSTTPPPPRSTTPCRFKAWAVEPSRWACTLRRRAWPWCLTATSTAWAARASRRFMCRATRSPCCLMQ